MTKLLGTMVAVGLAVVAASAGCGDETTTQPGRGPEADRYAGRVAAAAVLGEADPSVPPRWLIELDLDGREVLSSSTVIVSFDAADLRCETFDPLTPADLEVGQAVSFTRIGDTADASDPPVVTGSELRAKC